MRSLKAFASKLQHTLILYGGWGLFGISALDSAGVSMPGVKDVLLIYLCSRHPARTWIYVLGCTFGTILGSFFIYVIGRTGMRLFKRKPSENDMGRATRWLVKNDFLTVLVASLLPPPLPFKPILLCSGALRMSAGRFCLALLVGAVARFGLEAWVGVHYGTKGVSYLKTNFVWICLALVAIVVVFTLIYRWFWGTTDENQPTASPTTASSRRR